MERVFNPEAVPAKYEAAFGVGTWALLSHEQQTEQLEYARAMFGREDAEKKSKQSDVDFVCGTLKGLGVKMAVHGCGCCDSPAVTFEYRGRRVEQSYFNFDTEAPDAS